MNGARGLRNEHSEAELLCVVVRGRRCMTRMGLELQPLSPVTCRVHFPSRKSQIQKCGKRITPLYWDLRICKVSLIPILQGRKVRLRLSNLEMAELASNPVDVTLNPYLTGS